MSECIKTILIKITAIFLVIIMYLIYIFNKFLIPGMVISYLTKLNLIVSVLCYILLCLIFFVLIRIFDHVSIHKEELNTFDEFTEL